MDEIKKETVIVAAVSVNNMSIKVGEKDWYHMNMGLTAVFKNAIKSVFSDLAKGDKVELTGNLDKKQFNVIDIKEKGKPQENSKENKMVHFDDLLERGHTKGIKSLTTKMLHYDLEKKEAIFRATLIGKNDEKFIAHGDVLSTNITGESAKHWLRVGETRSLVRVLRFYLGESNVAEEELTKTDKKFKEGKLK